MEFIINHVCEVKQILWVFSLGGLKTLFYSRDSFKLGTRSMDGWRYNTVLRLMVCWSRHILRAQILQTLRKIKAMVATENEFDFP